MQRNVYLQGGALFEDGAMGGQGLLAAGKL
jgi:hypothetical protein